MYIKLIRQYSYVCSYTEQNYGICLCISRSSVTIFIMREEGGATNIINALIYRRVSTLLIISMYVMVMCRCSV